MGILSSINGSLQKAMVDSYGRLIDNNIRTAVRQVGQELTVYPEDTGERYIQKGYGMNDSVYSIVSTNAEKAAQVRFYHTRVKSSERKTLREYLALTKGAINDRVLKEATRMRKAMIEDYLVDTDLAKRLNKPNRRQTQSEFIEQLFGLRELQGEGNIWIVADDDETPLELFPIPKPHLLMVGDGTDPWEIIRFEISVNGKDNTKVDVEDIIMWKYANPGPIDNMLGHLRGLAPLKAAMLLVQGMNEGDKRIATSNANGGASGLLFRIDKHAEPSAAQALETRRQVNNTVNSVEMVGKVAVMSGEWDYKNFGVTTKDQMLLEQFGYGFKRLCRVFKTPAGIFDEGTATWDNQKQFSRRWIYSKIAPNLYSLRDHLNNNLLSRYKLDPERNLIDCDIMSLPELSEDMKEQIAAVKDAEWMRIDEKRSFTGLEPIGGKPGKLILVNGGKQSLEEIAEGTIDDDDNEIED